MMGAVWLVFAAKLRRYWWSWLLLSLLIAVASGFVLAAAAAGRRTDSAFPRYVASHGYDAIVYSVRPLPQLARLPEVAQVTPVKMPFYGQPRCSCQRRIDMSAFSVREVRPAGLRRVAKLVAGRMPDQSSPHEALASFTLERDYDVHLGTVIGLPMAAASQRHAVFRAMAGGPVPKPAGPTIAVRVVGIVAAENEFPAGQSPAYDLYPTQAFAEATRGTPALPAYYVRLRHGQASFGRFEAKASGLNGAGVQDLARPAAAIISSIHPQAVGWAVLAALAGLVAIAVVGQALARQTSAENTDHAALAALGLSPRQLAALGMLRTLAAAVAGAAGAMVVATLLSPLAPVGEARLAEPSPGLSFDAVVIGLGALAAVAVVLVLGMLPALRAARVRGAADRGPATRPSAVASAAAAAGVPASAVIGIRHALERRRGTRTIPVGTALIGSVAAVAAVCATAVFGTSLAHLTTTPALYGAPFQAYFNASGPGATDGRSVLTELKRDGAIGRITLVSVPAITVNHISVRAIAATAVRGRMLLSAAEGRLPAANDEMALGASTMRRIGAGIGSLVRVSVTSPDGAPHTRPFRVVGLLAFPGDFGTGGLGTGAALTTAGYIGAQCPPSPGQARCRRAAEARPADAILVRAAPGPAGSTALAGHIRRHHDNASRSVVPVALVNFGGSASFPLLLGAVVALCGLATLAHLLVVSVARRRTERGLLMAIGMVRRQLAAIVFWQATTIAVAAIAAGIPLGIAAGQAIWRAFAISLGVVPVPVVQAWLIGALAASVLLTANALATVPAVTAARSRPGQLLRTE
jgi:ABC-type lipoprotein release transport system permease subunit